MDVKKVKTNHGVNIILWGIIVFITIILIIGVVKAKELVKILNNNGWYESRTVGSHHQYKNPNKSGLITVPYTSGNTQIAQHTYKNIITDAGLSIKEHPY